MQMFYSNVKKNAIDLNYCLKKLKELILIRKLLNHQAFFKMHLKKS